MDKLIAMLERLLVKTQSSNAKWSNGSRSDTFIWSGSKASVAVLSQDNDGQSPYLIRLINEDGLTLEEITQSWDGPYFQLFKDLYLAARSDALDITLALDSLIEDLD